MSCSRTAFLHLRRSHSSVLEVAFLRAGGRIPVMGLGAYPPPPPPPIFQCAVLSLEGDSVRVAMYTAVLTGSRVLILAAAGSGMIVCR